MIPKNQNSLFQKVVILSLTLSFTLFSMQGERIYFVPVCMLNKLKIMLAQNGMHAVKIAAMTTLAVVHTIKKIKPTIQKAAAVRYQKI